MCTMLNQFKLVLLRYKPIAFWSFTTTMVLTIITSEIIYVLITKLFLIAILGYAIYSTTTNGEVVKKLNIASVSFKWASLLFLIDNVITLGYLLILKEFK